MKQTQETGARIVSKTRYLQIQAERAFWWLDSLLLSLVALTCLLILVGFAGGVLRFAPWPLLRDLAVTQQVWLLLLLPLLLHGCFATAKSCLARSRRRAVLPLTRATLSHLPANDSLVRASHEPEQAQASVLLRATARTQEQHEEQLLHVAVGRSVHE